MIKEKLEVDLKNAMRSKDEIKISTLRMLLSDIHNKEIDKKDRLSEEELIRVLQSSIKKHDDSIEQFKTGGRADLVEKETTEKNIIKSYLPEELPQEEVKKIVDAVISKMGQVSEKDFGRIIKEAMKEIKGRAGGSLVSQIVKESLNSVTGSSS